MAHNDGESARGEKKVLHMRIFDWTTFEIVLSVGNHIDLSYGFPPFGFANTDHKIIFKKKKSDIFLRENEPDS